MNEFLIFQGMTPEMVLWPIFIGVCAAVLYSQFIKGRLGPFVKALIKANANSPESALTLEELGFDKNKHVLYELKRKNGLSGLVERCESVNSDADISPDDVEKSQSGEKIVRYYIPEQNADRAESMYANGGASWKITLAIIGAFLLVIILLIKLMPVLENLINYFGAFI